MAKEEIYTIPLWDAVRADDECPFCYIEKKLEKDLLDFCLSDAYMDDDFRQETNQIGFCSQHYDQLFHSKNRLGLTLINQTYIQTMMKSFDRALKTSSTKESFFKKSSSPSDLDRLYQLLTEDCYICKRIESTMERYYDTFFYLYKKESEFVHHLGNTKGFCMPHYIKLIQAAKASSNKTLMDAFMKQTLPLFQENMQRVLDDMQWFVNKYDYRYEDEPWKEAKDAPKRSIQKICKIILESNESSNKS